MRDWWHSRIPHTISRFFLRKVFICHTLVGILIFWLFFDFFWIFRFFDFFLIFWLFFDFLIFFWFLWFFWFFDFFNDFLMFFLIFRNDVRDFFEWFTRGYAAGTMSKICKNSFIDNKWVFLLHGFLFFPLDVLSALVSNRITVFV